MGLLRGGDKERVNTANSSAGRLRGGQGSALPRTARLLARGVSRTVLYLVILAGGALLFTPFVWMLSTSVKPGYLVFVMPPVWIPDKLLWSNFIEPWSMMPWLDYYRNTLILVVFNTIGTLVSSALTAYAFSRLRFRGRNALFICVLSTMMLPGHVTLIPQYVLFSKLGWVNSLKPLIVPSYFGNAFNIFLLRQFFMTIHPELDDAAKIDGCGILGTFWRVLLPLSLPALGVVGIFSFTGNWNNFFGPLIYLDSPKWFPVSLGLRLMQSRDDMQIQYTMAMTTISVIPVLAVFFIAQKRFIQGIVLTGVKG
jgi:multiple sugar transport system permease protein